MASSSFADRYRMGGLAPEPEQIERREQAFQGVRHNLDSPEIVDLARIYFELPDPSSSNFDWFASAFSENDRSFGMTNNEREASVLAACLLEATMKDNHPGAGLAVLCVSASGNREPFVLQDLVASISEDLDRFARDRRVRSKIKVEAVTASKPATLPSLGEEEEIDAAMINEALEQSQQAGSDAADQLATRARDVLAPIVNQMEDLREEVDILWWHVAGWSDILEQPYAETDPAVAGLTSGLKLGELTLNPPGGVAAPALLRRTIMAGRSGKRAVSADRQKVALHMAVEGIPKSRHGLLGHWGRLEGYMDACPIHAALYHYTRIGSSSAWHEAFIESTGLRPDIQLTPFQLGLQVYRESMLLTLLE